MQELLDSPLAPLGGGLLIGLAAALMMLFLGRVAGVSGVVGGLLGGRLEGWRSGFFLGLLLGGFVLSAATPYVFDVPQGRSLPMLIVAGLLVGVGTRMGNGCTSGHGVCGISRFAPRSLWATAAFLTTGFAMATLLHLLGSAS